MAEGTKGNYDSNGNTFETVCTRGGLFALRRGKAQFAVECIEVFGFDEIETCSMDVGKNFADLRMGDRLHGLRGTFKATTKMIGAKGLRHAIRPNLGATICEHREL